jgi:hypothetical protein
MPKTKKSTSKGSNVDQKEGCEKCESCGGCHAESDFDKSITGELDRRLSQFFHCDTDGLNKEVLKFNIDHPEVNPADRQSLIIQVLHSYAIPIVPEGVAMISNMRERKYQECLKKRKDQGKSITNEIKEECFDEVMK